MAEVNTKRTNGRHRAPRAVRSSFPGVLDHGMYERDCTGTWETLCPLPWKEEGTNNRNKAGGTSGHGESDYLVVPTMAGNAAGGKEVTYGRAT